MPERGKDQLAVYAEAMAHELEDNAHKGHWLESEPLPGQEPVPRTAEEMLGDLMYHAAKLALATALGDREAVLEYAADVGNCAWFVADREGALSASLLHEGPIEYDEEHRGLAKAGLPDLRKESHALSALVFRRVEQARLADEALEAVDAAEPGVPIESLQGPPWEDPPAAEGTGEGP